MNPIKVLRDTVPQLAKVLESIHAYLEEQLKTQNQILEELKKLNDIRGKK